MLMILTLGRKYIYQLRKDNDMNEEQRLELEKKIIDTIEQYDLDYNSGNAVAGIIRALFLSDGITELEGAKMAINRRINMIKENKKRG